ncbi:MAG: serine proteinase inhibitor [Clostridiales bacterium]|nr:serine proteinase inhibitor [Clostridiales bacterium]
MRRTRLIPFVAALLAAATLCGCAGSGPVSAGDLMQGVKAADWPGPPEQIDAELQRAMLDFSWRLFRETMGDTGNVLVSPTSVYLALAMTLNGADGETRIAMTKALSAQGMSQQALNEACRGWISILRTRTDKTQVSVANSIWFRQTYDVAEEFLKTNADYFDAGAQALDFRKPEAADTINSWVREHTNDLIDNIVGEIPAETIMYLINAVHFKSDWQVPFAASDTSEGIFYAPDGAVGAQLMRREGEIIYLDREGAQGVMLPYDDGRYSFFALLPPGGVSVREYAAELDATQIAGLLGAMEPGYVALTLPKFETRWEDSLREALTALGMGVAFSDGANLSRMSAKGARDLLISDVMQKTYCRVDEKGTEAAAVTSVIVGVTSMPLFDAEICFDRPFLYGIVDTASLTPLFLGILEKP